MTESNKVGRYCQVQVGDQWVRGKILLQPDEAKGVKGWKVLLFVAGGVEKYVTDPEEIKFEEGNSGSPS